MNKSCKATYWLVVFLVLQVTLFAQDDYLVHTIKNGETLSSIAKHFHTSVGSIMRLNAMNAKTKLRIGQKIKIPAEADNAKSLIAQPSAENNEIKVKESNSKVEMQPSTFHVVTGKETLWSISKKYKTSVDNLKKWNHLSNNNIHSGEKLVVAVEAAGVVAAHQPTSEAVAVVKTESQPQPIAVKKDTVTVQSNTSSTPVTNKVSEVTATAVTNKKEEKAVEVSNNSITVGEEGFFASAYKSTNNEISGNAATFKTASGWLDKKFYVLMNNVAEGTIVCVTANTKKIYAKVLGPLPDIKEDNGLLLRISNAAVTALGIGNDKFSVTVNY